MPTGFSEIGILSSWIHFSVMTVATVTFVGVPMMSSVYENNVFAEAKPIGGVSGTNLSTCACNNITNSVEFNGNMKNKKIYNLLNPTDSFDAATKRYVDEEISKMHPTGIVSNNGSSITKLYIDELIENSRFKGDMLNKRIYNLGNPSGSYDAVNKQYADSLKILNDKGELNMNSMKIFNLATPGSTNEAATKGYVDGEIIRNKFNGDMAFNKISNLGNPSSQFDAATKQYVDKIFDNATGNMNMNGNNIYNLATPLTDNDATNKKYVDNAIINNKFSGDMNNQRIYNLATPGNDHEGANKLYVDNAITNNRFDGEMNNQRIMNLANPNDDTDAANKKYVDNQISSHKFAGDMNNQKIYNLAAPTNVKDAVTKEYVDNIVSAGSSFVGDMNNQKIYNLGDPTNVKDATTKEYVDTEISNSKFTGDMNSQKITNVAQPSTDTDAANKIYVDNQISSNKFAGDMNNQKIYNLATPNSATDAVTKQYVDNIVSAGSSFTGDMNNQKIYNLGSPTDNKDASTKEYVDTEISNNKFVGDMSNQKIYNLASPTSANDATTKEYVDNIVSAGSSFTGDMKTQKIYNLADPTDDADATNKKYVDDEIANNKGLTISEYGNVQLTNSGKEIFGEYLGSSNALDVDGKGPEYPLVDQFDTSTPLTGGGHYRLIDDTKDGVLFGFNLLDTFRFTEIKVVERWGFSSRVNEIFFKLYLDGNLVFTGNKGNVLNTMDVKANKFELILAAGASGYNHQFNYVFFKYYKIYPTDKQVVFDNMFNGNMKNKPITNLQSPKLDTDAANKKYVDDEVSKGIIISEYGTVMTTNSGKEIFGEYLGNSNIFDAHNKIDHYPLVDISSTSTPSNGGGHYQLIDDTKDGILLAFKLLETYRFTEIKIGARGGANERVDEIFYKLYLDDTLVFTGSKGVNGDTMDIKANKFELILAAGAVGFNHQFNYVFFKYQKIYPTDKQLIFDKMFDGNMNDKVITNLQTPVLGDDAANKDYVDGEIAKIPGVSISEYGSSRVSKFGEIFGEYLGTSNVFDPYGTDPEFPFVDLMDSNTPSNGGGHYKLINSSMDGVLFSVKLLYTCRITEGRIYPRPSQYYRSDRLFFKLYMDDTLVYTSSPGPAGSSMDVIANRIDLLLKAGSTSHHNQFNYIAFRYSPVVNRTLQELAENMFVNSANSKILHNLQTPIVPTDAANKYYVDDEITKKINKIKEIDNTLTHDLPHTTSKTGRVLFKKSHGYSNLANYWGPWFVDPLEEQLSEEMKGIDYAGGHWKHLNKSQEAILLDVDLDPDYLIYSLYISPRPGSSIHVSRTDHLYFRFYKNGQVIHETEKLRTRTHLLDREADRMQLVFDTTGNNTYCQFNHVVFYYRNRNFTIDSMAKYMTNVQYGQENKAITVNKVPMGESDPISRYWHDRKIINYYTEDNNDWNGVIHGGKTVKLPKFDRNVYGWLIFKVRIYDYFYYHMSKTIEKILLPALSHEDSITLDYLEIHTVRIMMNYTSFEVTPTFTYRKSTNFTEVIDRNNNAAYYIGHIWLIHDPLTYDAKDLYT